MKTRVIFMGVVATGFAVAIYASTAGAEQDTPTPPTFIVTTIPESPPTTSEFGNEQEITIALDEVGNIVPG